jgi:hypothetical protein
MRREAGERQVPKADVSVVVGMQERWPLQPLLVLRRNKRYELFLGCRPNREISPKM